PQMSPISTGTGQIFIYAVQDPRRDNMDLRTIQDWTIKPVLKTVPGVADVLTFGGFVKQYQVRIDADRLQSRGIALSGVMDAISKNNANAGGNFIEHGADQYVVRGIGLAENVRDIGNIVLSTDKGVPVYLRDVADVQIGPELRQGAVDLNGRGEIVAGI